MLGFKVRNSLNLYVTPKCELNIRQIRVLPIFRVAASFMHVVKIDENKLFMRICRNYANFISKAYIFYFIDHYIICLNNYLNN